MTPIYLDGLVEPDPERAIHVAAPSQEAETRYRRVAHAFGLEATGHDRGRPQERSDGFRKLETSATSEPGYVEHVAEIVRELEDDPAMVTFGLCTPLSTP